jgi:uncharacterized membrane protein
VPPIPDTHADTEAGTNPSASTNGTAPVPDPVVQGAVLRARLHALSARVPPPVRPVLLGAATGLRSQMGLAAVLLATGEGGRDRLPQRLRNSGALRSALIAAVAELIADKTPFPKSRLAPGGLATRVVLAGYAAMTLAKVEGRDGTTDMVAAAIAAAVAAKVGHDLRAVCARRVPDRLVALAEDAVAVALAAAAVSGVA